MRTVPIELAEGHLAEIIDKLTPGEEIMLTRHNQSVATINATTPRRAPGSAR